MKLPPSSRNWLTIIGSIIAGINLALILVLFLISTFFNESDSTNLGLFIYVILPGFMILGLLLIPIGMIRERGRQSHMADRKSAPLPRIDLNDPRHKNAFIIFTIATIIILFLSTLGSFEAYHMTESVEFCGTLCHEVMEPEHTAYQKSPHANVTCVECHVGSGASWYVKSKISGLHQVIAVITNDFSRPINTPLHDLRPARETCEKCHWPQKFYARSLRTIKYFLTDSANSEWDIMLQMKTGPEYSELGLKEGIHWHINPTIDVSYKSEGDTRETITYIRYTNKATGEEHVYQNSNLTVSDSSLAVSETRSMDCIDCHNRPSHNYTSPSSYFDNAMLLGDVSKKIPYIKQITMGILAERFTNKDSALMKISEEITNHYKTEMNDFYEANKELFNKSIESIQKGFSQNTFPAMGVRYDVYPDHIGHQESEGCFRCHNNQFISESGRVISKDCNLCHTIIGQGKPGMMKYSTIRENLEFEHPVDIGTDWKDMNCSDCHESLY
jgi:hypothetical protein